MSECKHEWCDALVTNGDGLTERVGYLSAHAADAPFYMMLDHNGGGYRFWCHEHRPELFRKEEE